MRYTRTHDTLQSAHLLRSDRTHARTRAARRRARLTRVIAHLVYLPGNISPSSINISENVFVAHAHLRGGFVCARCHYHDALRTRGRCRDRNARSRVLPTFVLRCAIIIEAYCRVRCILFYILQAAARRAHGNITISARITRFALVILPHARRKYLFCTSLHAVAHTPTHRVLHHHTRAFTRCPSLWFLRFLR